MDVEFRSGFLKLACSGDWVIDVVAPCILQRLAPARADANILAAARFKP